jgi:hypothetical protein
MLRQSNIVQLCFWYYLGCFSNRQYAASVVYGLARWPLVPKFAGSNPAEAVEFFMAKKSSARLPSEGK